MADKRASLKAVRFKWSGIGTDGATLSGELVAPSEVRARMALRQQGITPTRVDRSRRHATRLPAKTVAFLLRQLATLIRSGVPILSAFDIIARSQERPEATQILLQIRTDLQTGASLATALTRHPANFDELTCTLVAAGEQSGLLDVMLARIADYQEKMLAIHSKLRSALTYPIAILSVAAIVTILMLVYVVPAFENTFSSFGAALPLPTRVIINGSAALRDYGPILALGCSAMAAGLIHQWRKNIPWQETTDRWLLTLPILGSLFSRAALARWSRTLASLYGAGIPLLESLTPAGNATGNRLYQQASQALCQKVNQGDNLSRALARQSVFSPLLVQMVGIGEESGTLDEMLNKVADIYDREVNDAVTQLGTLMEPLLMVLLGGIIGGLVIAMYLPIFQLGTVL
ncbi:MAG: type secretion system protein [Pseudomonadota bacterium]|jgi:type IV pilus assembly protein PilC